MSANIKDEIARRVGSAPEDVAPVLETVVLRIRQQVEHYGYARLAGLGTFRGRNGGIVFEPDVALEETVNARFAGLHEIVIEPASDREAAGKPEPSTEAADSTAAEEAVEQTAGPVEGIEGLEDEADKAEGTPIPEDSERSAEFVPPATVDEPVEPPGFEDAEKTPEFDEAEEAPEFGEPVDASGYDEAKVDDGEALRSELDRPAEEEHPPEAESEPSYEEAGYSVLGASDEDSARPEEEEEEKEPTIAWAPIGEPEEESEEAAVPSDSVGSDESAEEEVAYAGESADSSTEVSPPAEAEDEPVRPKAAPAPDRPAHPHGMRGGAATRGVRPRSGESKRGPDPKIIWFGAGIIVIVAAAAIAYFVLPARPAGPAETETTRTELPAAPDTAATASADTAAAAVDAAPADATPPPPSSALRSESGIDQSRGGFTIVVYSETNQNLAENAAQEYRDQGLRTSVLALVEDGVTRYRVGVGQFETLEEAAEARDELAGDELPDDSWVLRL